MWSCSVRKIIEERLKKEAQQWDCDNTVAHSKALRRRMYQAPAELSIQSSPLWGQKGQDGGTLLGN